MVTSSPTACSKASDISWPHVLLMFLYLMHKHHPLSLSILLIQSPGRARLSADFHRSDVTRLLTEVGRLAIIGSEFWDIAQTRKGVTVYRLRSPFQPQSVCRCWNLSRGISCKIRVNRMDTGQEGSIRRCIGGGSVAVGGIRARRRSMEFISVTSV
jgi:hypothetical protein